MLSEEKAEIFHNINAKCLFYAKDQDQTSNLQFHSCAAEWIIQMR